MEIEHRLSRFPVPERVQREWEYDMRISARGVAADRELVDGALYCGTAIEEAAKPGSHRADRSGESQEP